MKPISEMTKKDIKEIESIVFDVDGVLVPRGTKIRQNDNETWYTTKKIPLQLYNDIKVLALMGYDIIIASGRGLYMLQDMFRSSLPFMTIIYENGSASWFNGMIEVFAPDAFEALHPLRMKLEKIKSKNIKGFEPKEFIITLHCTDRVPEVEALVKKFPDIYCLWNGEAYDFGVKHYQNKGEAINRVIEGLGVEKKGVLAIGDNYNDKELLDCAKVKVTADKTRLKGNFYVELEGKELPGQVLAKKLIELNQNV